MLLIRMKNAKNLSDNKSHDKSKRDVFEVDSNIDEIKTCSNTLLKCLSMITKKINQDNDSTLFQ